MSRLGGSVAAIPSTLAGKLEFIIVHWQEMAALYAHARPQIDSSAGNLVPPSINLLEKQWNVLDVVRRQVRSLLPSLL
jgi:hypothetical protein